MSNFYETSGLVQSQFDPRLAWKVRAQAFEAYMLALEAKVLQFMPAWGLITVSKNWHVAPSWVCKQLPAVLYVQ